MTNHQKPILEVEDLCGGYSKNKPVLHHLRFQVRTNEIVGLIGLNGAGKSTTIKHILGLLDPTSGSIRINGLSRDQQREAYQSQLTYIPETPIFYEQLTLWEHLELTAMAYDLPEEEWVPRAQFLLKQFRMEPMKHWMPDTFSKGMKQKLMIICAFLSEPSLYVIDEPFLGLDPRAIRALLDLMKTRQKGGAGILVSTHILPTAELFCDRFVLLHEGRVLLQGTLGDLRDQTKLPEATLDEIFMQVTEVRRDDE
ncbi:ABC transporter ATP-binding protein [Ammoniphilus sp. CFH 90114]|uniref:ABC transporter ATP-binding protein n=1 Tax=Ammoniphilus sp. CFH 90114 TaxID=2493665 RepID=UPI00100E27AD|nr:ABC transporter ATP-binding protein [Ammoniphilus sp. CFH 90114]RXT04203.1 ABC transporter ATP-binding protein [Ammoniphilus sp. CFH 90114]